MPRPNQSIFSQTESGNSPSPNQPVQGGGAPVPIPPELRSQGLYGGDPTAAMMNVLMDMGYSPFRTNPFVSAMLRSAPGLNNLWMLSNIGANPGDMAAQGGPAAMFGNFLRGQLQNGTTFSSLAGGLGNFGNYVGQLRDLQNRLTAGQVPISQVPVFLDDLESQLESPNGFAGIYGSLAQPLLGPQLGRSFQNSLGGVATAANQRYIKGPTFGQPTGSFLDVLMGR